MPENQHDEDQTISFVPLTEGAKVGHYTIISKIGAGGMGEVYLAEDTKLNRKVALKFMPVHMAGNADLRSRFIREAQAAAKLDHPNIVPVYEVGEYQGRPYFAMAHIEGRSLRDIIKEGKLGTDEAVGLAMQILEGLQKAHDAGVVHRDIKPGNIIIDKDNRARLVDFGLAMVCGEEKLTKTGSTLGTVGYMSPEQVEGKKCDHRSDLFSVGVILYEMLTGRRPFEGDNDAAIARAITDSTPEPIARFKSGTTGETQQIVDKALSKDPSIRYQTAAGMLADLRRLGVGAVKLQKSNARLYLTAAVIIVAAITAYFIIDRYRISTKPNNEGWTNSIAVLVFRNLSADPEQDYFCEGMTEEIIGRLTTIKNLKVPGTQSMIRFKDTNLDLKNIGKELKVDNILAGSIMQEGDSIRVRAELIRLEDGASIWSEKYDRELTSTFAIQDDISQSIAHVLEATLVGTELPFASRRGTESIDAYNEYVKGRHFWRKRTQEGLTAAIEHFEKAVAIDSNYAAGWSGLSDGWIMLALYGYLDYLTGFAKADTASRKALVLNPNLAEAQSSRAYLLLKQTKFVESEEHFLKAIELNPNYPWAHLWYYVLLEETGNSVRASDEITIAYELDPLSPALLNELAKSYRREGKFDESIDCFKQILEIEPEHTTSYVNMTAIYLDRKDSLKAIETANRMIKLIPDNYQSYTNKGWLLWQLGRMDEAEAQYKKAIEINPDLWSPYSEYAWFLQDGRGDFQAALKQIERAVELDSLQANVRRSYGNLLRNVGRVNEAIEQCEKAIELAPYDPESYRMYGWTIANGQGRYADAIEYMNKALEINPYHAATLNSISLMYSKIGNTEKALEAIDKRIKIDKSYVAAYLRKGEICLSGGMLDTALAAFTYYSERRPHDLYVIRYIGDINTFLGNYGAADSIYSVMLCNQNAARRGWGRYYRSWPLRRQGKFQEALDLLQKGIETDQEEIGPCWPMILKLFACVTIDLEYSNRPETASVVLNRIRTAYDSIESNDVGWAAIIDAVQARIQGRLGDVENCMRGLRLGLERGDNYDVSRPYRYCLASFFRQTGEYDSAAYHFQILADARPQLDHLLWLGASLVGSGHFEDAVALLEQAMTKYNDRLRSPEESVLCHYYLARAYDGVGRTEDAINQYETFLDIWKNADEGLKPLEDAKQRLAKLKKII